MLILTSFCATKTFVEFRASHRRFLSRPPTRKNRTPHYQCSLTSRNTSSSTTPTHKQSAMGVFSKVKDQFTQSTPSYDFPPPTPSISLGPRAIFRYRKQRGVNLGSWFSLEQWICPHVFRGAKPPGQSDYDVASGNDAKRILEEHWDTWINEDDMKWIASRGFNSVRLPVSLPQIWAIVTC